jgi:catechol-2,3-dioxygenase
MRIRELRLQTSHIDTQKEFYTQRLGLPLVDETDSSVAIQIGETRLVFTQAEEGTEPYYHFAFNISENKLLLAKAWLAERQIALSRDDPDNSYSKSWNSHAIYFYDAAGNIVEFIARHSLPNAQEGPFTTQDLLYASEIGLVTDDVLAMVERLREAFGVEVYKGGISEEFAALGDEQGLFILSRRGRVWLMSDKQAQIYPIEVRMQDGSAKTCEFADLPYSISGDGGERVSQIWLKIDDV